MTWLVHQPLMLVHSSLLKKKWYNLKNVSYYFTTLALFNVLIFFAAIDQVLQQLKSLDLRLTAIEKIASSTSKPVHEIDVKKQPSVEEKKKPVDDDDDVDLFGSDSEEESAEAAKIREDRLKAYAAKKSKSNSLFHY